MKMLIRNIREKIKIKDLFEKVGVKDEENALEQIKFPLKVNTPYGFKKIVTAFRTENQKTVTSYFGNNKTLKTSENHRLKVNSQWKHVKDIQIDELVETECGDTKLISKSQGKEEVLYDISVDEVHCYFSNGILSHNSWVLAKLGAEAMKQGKNVLHYTLELNENYVGLRYDACFTGIDFQNIRSNVDAVKKKIAEVPGKLIIKYFPIKTVSAHSLKLHAERIQTLGTKIDVIIVDYADILRPSQSDRNSNSYSEAGGIYEELRGVAGEMQLPIWTASQSNRCLSVESVVNEEVRGLIKIGDLTIGEKILTIEGFKKVINIFPQQTQPVYRIKLKSGKYIDCSSNHRFPTMYGKIRTIETGLSIGDKLFIKK